MYKDLIKYLERFPEDNEEALKELREDRMPDLNLEVVSAYGGMVVGIVKCSDAIEMIEEEQREINLDYYLFVEK